MEFSSAIRTNELLIYTTIWMTLQRIMLHKKIKSIPECYIQYDFIYIAFLKWLNYFNGEQIGDRNKEGDRSSVVRKGKCEGSL